MDNSDLGEELLFKLKEDLNESWEQLKHLRDTIKRGSLGLEEYKTSKLELESRINDLSNRIYYINKAMRQIPDRDERILQEAQMLKNEYQIELINEKMSHLKIYLTISVYETWIIEINFIEPKVPIFKIPPDLHKLIGDPYETILSLKTWQGRPDQHLIIIIREIEQKLLNRELTKSIPELEIERGRVMVQAKSLEEKKAFEEAMNFYNYAADISGRIGNHAIAMVCRMKAKRMAEAIENKKF